MARTATVRWGDSEVELTESKHSRSQLFGELGNGWTLVVEDLPRGRVSAWIESTIHRDGTIAAIEGLASATAQGAVDKLKELVESIPR